MNDALGLKDDSPAGPPPAGTAWNILIVDDDPEVHSVTRLALDGFTFAGRGLRFINAYSGAQARQLLQSEPGIAVMLLDVVMEADDSGLAVVNFVRNELCNPFLRIVLRTGQPGQAPELEVISKYDINDYKHKTELTRERLYTTIYTSLSTYRDLVMLDASRRGLEKVIEASARIFELRSMDQFAQGVLDQLIALLLFDADAVMLQVGGIAGVAAEVDPGRLRIVAGTGAFGSLVGRDARDALPAEVVERITTALSGPDTRIAHDHFIGIQHAGDSSDLVFYVAAARKMPAPDRRLLEVFCRNVGIARANVQIIARAMGVCPQ
jgi:CheY-like chemotaxis protein